MLIGQGCKDNIGIGLSKVVVVVIATVVVFDYSAPYMNINRKNIK